MSKFIAREKSDDDVAIEIDEGEQDSDFSYYSSASEVSSDRPVIRSTPRIDPSMARAIPHEYFVKPKYRS